MRLSLEKLLVGREANALANDYLFSEYCKYRVNLFIPAILASIVITLFDHRLENVGLAWFWLMTMFVIELLKVNLARLNLANAFQYKKPFLFFDYLANIWLICYLMMLGWQSQTEAEAVFKCFFVYAFLVFQLDALRLDITKLVSHSAIICFGILFYLLMVTSFDSQITFFYATVVLFGFFIFVYFGRNSHILALETYDLLLESERLLSKVDDLLVLDEMTQQYNRRYFDAQLNKYVTRYQTNKEPFTLALLSVDFFERVEDAYGAHVGQQILISAAAYIREQLKNSRVFAKYNDEAFALILPNTPLAKASDELDALKRAFADNRFQFAEGDVSITLSIGITEVREADAEATILDRADQALHQAKKSGSNHISALT